MTLAAIDMPCSFLPVGQHLWKKPPKGMPVFGNAAQLALEMSVLDASFMLLRSIHGRLAVLHHDREIVVLVVPSSDRHVRPFLLRILCIGNVRGCPNLDHHLDQLAVFFGACQAAAKLVLIRFAVPFAAEGEEASFIDEDQDARAFQSYSPVFIQVRLSPPPFKRDSILRLKGGGSSFEE